MNGLMNLSQTRRGVLFGLVGLALLAVGVWALWRLGWVELVDSPLEFSAERAYQDVLTQMTFGPRLMGSPAHTRFRSWLIQELELAGWLVEVQACTDCAPLPLYNLVARRPLPPREADWVILGAHYDSRFYADQDPDPANRSQSVPGANDGASGVAVLLELARTLPANLDKEVWLVFFDAEDNGNIPGYDWIMGSEFFVQSLVQQGGRLPNAAVIVDMIGDADLNVYRERNSDRLLTDVIWQQAAELGYGNWIINSPRHRILDDHIPFLEAGIPAVDMIDFDYPYWHTLEDTADKVSGESLKAVGQTLLVWLVRGELPAR